MRRFTVLSLVVLGGLQGASAIDVVIPYSTAYGTNPSSPGTGLCGDYWNMGPFYDNSTAWAHAGANPADATFKSTLLDYPNGGIDTLFDGNSLNDWLGIDAGTLMPAAVGSNALETSLWRFRGAISILDAYDQDSGAPGINVTFGLGSDDGSGLRIGGIDVIDNGGDHGFGYIVQRVSFEAAGLYPIDIIAYENFGITGIEWASSIPGGPDSGVPSGTVGVVPTSVLYRSDFGFVRLRRAGARLAPRDRLRRHPAGSAPPSTVKSAWRSGHALPGTPNPLDARGRIYE